MRLYILDPAHAFHFMIRPGLCSITFHALPAEDTLALAVAAGLEGIEWASKSHVPVGDFPAAERVKNETVGAGLSVTSYGTYYRVGSGEDFSPLLETADALGAPIIRVWAGQRDYAKSSSEDIKRVVDETLRLADLCTAAGLKIGFEHHDGTLTSRNAGASAFAALVEHPAVRFYWQPLKGFSPDYCLAGLEALKSRLAHVHVFHWTFGSPEANTLDPEKHEPTAETLFMHLLEDGRELWESYLRPLAEDPSEHWALLEFAKDNSVENFQKDAATLRAIIEHLSP
jgi:sugar phosphate isomerase/epimerase